MVTAPNGSNSSYQSLGRKSQDARNQTIETHLDAFNPTLTDRFDPDLTKRSESNKQRTIRYFTHHALVPVVGPIVYHLQETKREKRLSEINNEVSRKSTDDPRPYAIEECHFSSQKEAQKYVAKAHARMEADMHKWQQLLSTANQIDTIDTFLEIPVHTEPKVVTFIKTNRPKDAVEIFLDAKTYKPPVEPKKPGLLKRIANLLKPSPKEEYQQLLSTDSCTPQRSKYQSLQAPKTNPDLESEF